MSHDYKQATIFGGTGFVGAQIVRELAKMGVTVKVATRIPERAYFLKTCGNVGQIVPFACNYDDPDSIAAAVKGSDYVVNCIGILYQRGKNTFQRAHVEIPEAIAQACKKEKVERFVHISALGVDKSTSKYAQSKMEGEKAVGKAFKDTTILRPSVIFGANDNFFNMFARLAQVFPALPLIGGGKTRFQPVFVGDVADAAIAALTGSRVGEQNPCGNTYELGGPEILNFREIYERLFQHIGEKRCLIPLPFWLAKFEALFLSLLPNPLLTPDQVESLKHDSVVGEKALTLHDLGLHPTGMGLILPDYLEPYKIGGKFAEKKRA